MKVLPILGFSSENGLCFFYDSALKGANGARLVLTQGKPWIHPKYNPWYDSTFPWPLERIGPLSRNWTNKPLTGKSPIENWELRIGYLLSEEAELAPPQAGRPGGSWND